MCPSLMSVQMAGRPRRQGGDPRRLFSATARLTGPTGLTETVELLVDPRALLLTVPKVLAERLELRLGRSVAVRTAGGRQEIWPVAEVRLSLRRREVTTSCFLALGRRARLGSVALDSLLLAVDPVRKRLVSVPGKVFGAVG